LVWLGNVTGVDEWNLDELRWHWGSAYLISHPCLDVWLAQRRDDRDAIRAGTPGELHDRIVDDYTARPVPRVTVPFMLPVGNWVMPAAISQCQRKRRSEAMLRV